MQIVGSCPKCGAPIYSMDEGWMSILPPPVHYTCCCVAQPQSRTVTSTNIILDK